MGLSAHKRSELKHGGSEAMSCVGGRRLNPLREKESAKRKKRENRHGSLAHRETDSEGGWISEFRVIAYMLPLPKVQGKRRCECEGEWKRKGMLMCVKLTSTRQRASHCVSHACTCDTMNEH